MKESVALEETRSIAQTIFVRWSLHSIDSVAVWVTLWGQVIGTPSAFLFFRTVKSSIPVDGVMIKRQATDNYLEQTLTIIQFTTAQILNTIPRH